MMHFKNHNNKIFLLDYFSRARPELVEGYPRALEETLQQVQGERRKTLGKINGHKNGFTLIETVMALAITALVLTPIFIMHGTILKRVNNGSIAFDMLLYGKALLIEARQKQDPDAQDFMLEKTVGEFNATCKYALDKAVDQKSSVASLPGLHRESVTIDWVEQEQKKQERLVTFVYKKPEQKKQ